MSSSTVNRLEIREYETSRFDRPDLLVAVPEAGLVGAIASSYLIQQLHIPEVGYVESDLIPEVLVIHDGRPHPPIRVYGLEKLAIVVSEIPLNASLSIAFASEVAKWARTKAVRTVFGVTCVPYETRMEMAEGEKPKIFMLASNEELLNNYKNSGARLFQEGFLTGTYATLMKECSFNQQPIVTLMAEAYRQFPDPGAAAAMLEVLNNILDIHVNVEELLKQSEEIRLRLRQLMAQTQQNMRQQQQQQQRISETTPRYTQ